jgi:predicted RNA methylase
MTLDALRRLEAQRLELQAKLDAVKLRRERNQLGQFATPSQLAITILQHAARLFPGDQPVRFFDPAVGTGAFYSALLQAFAEERIDAAWGYEIDPHYGEASRRFWEGRGIEIVIGDFTRAAPPKHETDRFNLLICNPPYVRHHHIPADDKKDLQARAAQSFRIKPVGLAGLYVYFVGIAHAWLQDGGLAGWLIPGEFMEVNYGSVLRHYLTSQVTLLEIHRFDPLEVQFDDALVSSVIIWFRKQKPKPDHHVLFSLGGSPDRPRVQRQIALNALHDEPKWTRFLTPTVRSNSQTKTELRFRDLFEIKRGIATGANRFFILNTEQVHQHRLPDECLTPILPGPRYLETDEIEADVQGNPLLQNPLFLLDCALPEDRVQKQYPTLWSYLQSGVAQGVSNGYLCRHRALWYAQDKRAPSPFLCTYMGRPSGGHTVNPFRFILNHSRAVAPNVYLNIYPRRMLAAALVEKPDLKRIIWKSLQAITTDMLVSEGRVYGGGLYKIEPNELGNLPVTTVFDWYHEFLAVPPQQEILF